VAFWVSAAILVGSAVVCALVLASGTLTPAGPAVAAIPAVVPANPAAVPADPAAAPANPAAVPADPAGTPAA
jgi:hypothetical protein